MQEAWYVFSTEPDLVSRVQTFNTEWCDKTKIKTEWARLWDIAQCSSKTKTSEPPIQDQDLTEYDSEFR